MSRRAQVNESVQLSKKLSWLLRHGAQKEGLRFLPGGYLHLDSVLALPQFSRYTEEDVQAVVESNDKQRFHLTLDHDTSRLKIRANQGHSLQVDDLELDSITSSQDLPVVLHGTYYKFWQSIRLQGLKRQSRNHIHFASGEPGESGVISGMRGSCEIIIYLDLEKALAGGIQFFRSANNVILSPGNDQGAIPPQFFRRVLDRKTGKEIDFTEALPLNTEQMKDGATASAVVSPDDLADEMEKKRKHRRKKNQESNLQ